MPTEEPKGRPPVTPAANTPLTQDAINKLVGDARQEGHKAGATEALNGVDVADLTKRAEAGDALALANMTEGQRKDSELAKLQRDNAEAGSRMSLIAIEADIKVLASSNGAVDPSAVVALVDRSGIKYDPVTNAVTGAEFAVKALLTEKKYLVATAYVPNINPGGGNAPPAPTPLTSVEKVAANAMGLTDDQYQAGKDNIKPVPLSPFAPPVVSKT